MFFILTGIVLVYTLTYMFGALLINKFDVNKEELIKEKIHTMRIITTYLLIVSVIFLRYDKNDEFDVLLLIIALCSIPIGDSLYRYGKTNFSYIIYLFIEISVLNFILNRSDNIFASIIIFVSIILLIYMLETIFKLSSIIGKNKINVLFMAHVFTITYIFSIAIVNQNVYIKLSGIFYFIRNFIYFIRNYFNVEKSIITFLNIFFLWVFLIFIIISTIIK